MSKIANADQIALREHEYKRKNTILNLPVKSSKAFIRKNTRSTVMHRNQFEVPLISRSYNFPVFIPRKVVMATPVYTDFTTKNNENNEESHHFDDEKIACQALLYLFDQ